MQELYKVILGTDETGKNIEISDMERRKGQYFLGIQGWGKTSLLTFPYCDFSKYGC